MIGGRRVEIGEQGLGTGDRKQKRKKQIPHPVRGNFCARLPRASATGFGMTMFAELWVKAAVFGERR